MKHRDILDVENEWQPALTAVILLPTAVGVAKEYGHGLNLLDLSFLIFLNFLNFKNVFYNFLQFYVIYLFKKNKKLLITMGPPPIG